MSYSSWRSGRFGDALYRLVLGVLPARFRTLYEDEIVSYHHAQMHESEGSNWDRVRIWSRAIWDVLLHGMLERAKEAKQTITNAVHGALVKGGDPMQTRWHFALRKLRISTWFDWIAVRRLVKSPRFSIVTILTLGLGIGANTALFSVVHSVLLNPLPFENSEELVFAWETRDGGTRQTSVSLGNFQAWRSEATELQQMASARYRAFNVTGGDRPYRESGLEISAGLLSLFGAHPVHGREFTLDDERAGAEPVCMVSQSFWLDNLNETRDLSDLVLTLNGKSHTVVGVLPESFVVPSFGTRPIVTPIPLDPGDPGYWTNHNAQVFGRLADGVDLERANSELQAIASRLEEIHADDNDGIGAQLVPAREQLVQGAEAGLWILFGTVVFVLLIVCVNVASLLLARAAAAEKELAVRMAIGASRWRIVGLIFSEALLISLAGGIVGIAVGYWGVAAIRSWGPANLPRLNEVVVNLTVLSFALACALGAGLLFGLAPALRSSKVDIQTSLNKSGRTRGLGTNQRVQSSFVIAEVAIAVVLLNCSGLLLRSFTNLLDVDPGFDMDGRIAMQISLPGTRYSEHDRVTDFLYQLHKKLNAIPGVVESGSSVGLPFHWMMFRNYMTLEGRPAATIPEIPIVDVSISTPGYIETMNIELLRGRSILESDDSEGQFVAVVNEAFVRDNLDGDDPLGRRLRFSQPDALLPADEDPQDIPWYTVVGVVKDVKRWDLTSEASPEVFIPQSQHDWAREFFVVVHTSLPVEAVADQMRQAVWEIDPEQPVASIQPVEALFSNMIAQPRFNAVLVGAFGFTALVLALIGVYGLMANNVSARTQEIGVRIALGAKPSQIIGHIAGKGMTAALTGVAIGIGFSAVATRVMKSLLFGIQPVDLPIFALVILSVLLVAAFAASVPSWRAARLNATEALASD